MCVYWLLANAVVPGIWPLPACILGPGESVCTLGHLWICRFSTQFVHYFRLSNKSCYHTLQLRQQVTRSMPKSFCGICGASHKPEDYEACSKYSEQSSTVNTSSTRATRQSSKNMAKPNKEEDLSDLTTSVSVMSLEERERSALASIEQMELMQRVAEVEARRDRMMRDMEKRRMEEDVGFRIQDGAPAITTVAELPPKPEPVASGYSSYGTTRGRSKERRRGRSTSRSRSTSSKRRRSKWSLKRFTIGGKEVRKLNAYELILASISWCQSIEGLSIVDMKAFLDHMALIANRAMHDDFKDGAHYEYDCAIRKMAEKLGFAAFSRDNQGTSITHYGTQNLRPRSTVLYKQTPARKYDQPSKEGKRSCYRFNREGGCTLTEDRCGFGHFCNKCSSKSHGKHSCNKA